MNFVKQMEKEQKRIQKELQKQQKRYILSQNIMQGKMAENAFITEQTMKGNIVKRTGHGSDFEVQSYNPITQTKGRKILKEVKSGGAKPSELQEKTHKKYKGKHQFVRY